MDSTVLSVSEFVALTNQTLEYAYPLVVLEGEVSGFTVNQDKFVFFDLKDESASVGCFMMLFQLAIAIEDGMKVQISATPKLTNKGRFSLTVKQIRPLGEGDLQRAFELLKRKLQKEGIFSEERKRLLPDFPTSIGVISSEGAAGYKDFVKIIDKRWSGVNISLAHVQVQGDAAAKQIEAAFSYLNEHSQKYDVIALIRGGGSLDDLLAFNSEPVVRAIAASRLPVIVGVAHETDITLAGMAADVRASTPSEAAQILVPDKAEQREILSQIKQRLTQISISRERIISAKQRLQILLQSSGQELSHRKEMLASYRKSLSLANPQNILRKGYSVTRHKGKVVKKSSAVKKGDKLMIQLHQGDLVTEVKE